MVDLTAGMQASYCIASQTMTRHPVLGELVLSGLSSQTNLEERGMKRMERVSSKSRKSKKVNRRHPDLNKRIAMWKKRSFTCSQEKESIPARKICMQLGCSATQDAIRKRIPVPPTANGNLSVNTFICFPFSAIAESRGHSMQAFATWCHGQRTMRYLTQCAHAASPDTICPDCTRAPFDSLGAEKPCRRIFLQHSFECLNTRRWSLIMSFCRELEG